MKFAKKAIQTQKDRANTQVQLATIKELTDLVNQYKARQVFLDDIRRVSATPRIRLSKSPKGKRTMAAVVLASDWHVEETVTSESVSGINEYNLEIADQRIRRYFDAILYQLRHHRASGLVLIKELVLWLGGDLITGYIHEELVESNGCSPTNAVRWLIRRLRDGIHLLLNEGRLDHITLPCSYGNHGRTTAKRRASTGAANSFEQLMYYMLAEMFAGDERVHFHITDSAHQYIDVYGKVLHFHHGDEVKFLGGVGGLSVPLGKRVPMWDRTVRADYHHIGHYHTLRDFGRTLVNGSLIGPNAFSQSIGAEPEEPQQAFYLLDPKRGKCNVTPLWCAE